MSDYFMKSPCKHCPYRKDVKPFLTPQRGEELAYHASNTYNTFPCHKTTEEDLDSEDGDMIATENSKECAGFMTLQIIENGNTPPIGFTPAFDLVYSDIWDMVDAYNNN